LPNYGVFDEYRYFHPGKRIPVYSIGESSIGIGICEDIWYPEGPARLQSLAGAELIININASPYHIGKSRFREKMLAARAADYISSLAYLNVVGGQDELVFDGCSLVISHEGEILAAGKQFEEDMLVVDLDMEIVRTRRLQAPRRRHEVMQFDTRTVERITVQKRMKKKTPLSSPSAPSSRMEELQEIYSALVMGTRDYVRKNGFQTTIIGLSGGIDSALVACIAADAMGSENVRGLFMPSPYTSAKSREDVLSLARGLGIRVAEISISDIFRNYQLSLKPHLKTFAGDTTEENLQSRIRGNLLMAFSNNTGSLVLTTGNKSETSVGYATLYGDMAGGFAVIKDVPKTLVYKLCRWRNGISGKNVIPDRVLTKAPSAELKPGQKDTDALPPYDVLDPILKAYIEEDRTLAEILALGYGAQGTKDVLRMVDRSEYKRRQSPPGIKISRRAFGKDRRFPITNRYRGFS
jgi:NAD+ synthase (glutamine-hydrolysing)